MARGSSAEQSIKQTQKVGTSAFALVTDRVAHRFDHQVLRSLEVATHREKIGQRHDRMHITGRVTTSPTCLRQSAAGL